MTSLLRFAAAFALLVTAGCGTVTEYKPPAVGKKGEIMVVTDSATWNGPVGEALRATVGRSLRTFPQPTPAFTLRHESLSEFSLDGLRRQHSVIFAAPYTGTSETARFIRARLDSAGVQALERGGRGLITRPDLWMRDQLIAYATAPTDSALVQQLRAGGDDLRTAFNRLARTRTTEDMFDKARQTEIEADLLDRHGFAVGIQHDYVRAVDTTFVNDQGTRGTFVRYRRFAGQDSWRDFFVYYEEDPRLTRLAPEAVRALRNDLTQRFIRGTFADSYIAIEDRDPVGRPVEADTVDLGGRFAIETRGTWRLTGDIMGGPFVSYAFFDEDTGRFYLIDGMIFGPRYSAAEKREFLRQMEAIAYTFRTDGGGVEVLADSGDEG
ncbi:MAG: DUF4837 family protein [Bacteroidota bacterium]